MLTLVMVMGMMMIIIAIHDLIWIIIINIGFGSTALLHWSVWHDIVVHHWKWFIGQRFVWNLFLMLVSVVRWRIDMITVGLLIVSVAVMINIFLV
jgi:hypothetical protein